MGFIGRLMRLASAAATLGRLPHQEGPTAPIYVQLTEALDQLGRLDEVIEARNGKADG